MRTAIPENRALSDPERLLVEWLLEHGTGRAPLFLEQVASVTVATRCHCGCASIDFVVEGQPTPIHAGTEILADYKWTTPEGHIFGIFVFARRDVLSGLEVWSIDGRATPSALPAVDQLRPVDSPDLI